ncbi:hypothetical protein [Flavobacterium hiemivividum]|uniref:hypothetical protein n=1 Tax=Flavobacterium hiemivividum TaxID=2541734 RepID=UPI0014055509|nr:hypothetical protein [Flavobacterium hiemivividum]
MNRVRIIGLVLVIIGIILHLSFENDGIDFLTGAFVGGGVTLLFTGQFKLKKTN